MNDELELAGLTLFDRQEVSHISARDFRRLLATAVAARDELRVNGQGVLPDLSEIELTIIDDPAIARVHDEFFDDPTPTDVITFDHGEILVSIETAGRQAKKFDSDLLRELALYLIHGLAHLAGYDDQDEEDRAEMDQVQQDLLERLW